MDTGVGVVDTVVVTRVVVSRAAAVAAVAVAVTRAVVTGVVVAEATVEEEDEVEEEVVEEEEESATNSETREAVPMETDADSSMKVVAVAVVEDMEEVVVEAEEARGYFIFSFCI